MKKIILGMLVLAAITGTSCKKDKDDSSCEKSVAGIAGSYKITKLVVGATGIPDQDQTSTGLTDCERNGVYQLKADKSVIYTETGTCSDNGVGTWDVANDKITIVTTGGSIDFSATPITFDCTTLAVTYDLGSAGAFQRYTFTKQ